MNSDGMENDGRDEQALHGGFDWAGVSSGQATEFLWRCDAMRAGQLYQRRLFDSRDEAEEFARNMRTSEPDQMFSVEAILASTVWN